MWEDTETISDLESDEQQISEYSSPTKRNFGGLIRKSSQTSAMGERQMSVMSDTKSRRESVQNYQLRQAYGTSLVSRKGISTARSKNDIAEVKIYNQHLVNNQRNSIVEQDSSFNRAS